MSTIFRNHMTADGLWVKVTLLSANLQTKRRLKWTCFDGEIESQTRVPPVSSLTFDLSSVLRVNRDTVEKIKLVFLVILTIFSLILTKTLQIHDLNFFLYLTLEAWEAT